MNCLVVKRLVTVMLACLPLTAIRCIEEPRPEQITELEKLPPPTQEGKHTMGFLLNGRAWIPHSYIRYWARMDFIESIFGDNSAVHRYSTIIHGSGKVDMSEVILYIEIDDYDHLLAGKTYNLENNDSAFARLNLDGLSVQISCDYNREDVLEGELLVTHYDKEKRILAGTFWATYLSGFCDTARVTDGRFDLKY